jgi:hypothetical protein
LVVNTKIQNVYQIYHPTLTYVAKFRQLTFDVNWNEKGYINQFCWGLNDDVEDFMFIMSKVNTLSEFITQAMAYSIIVYSKGNKKSETMIFPTTINKYIYKNIAYNLWPNIRSQSYASQHWKIQAFDISDKQMLTKIKFLIILWKT